MKKTWVEIICDSCGCAEHFRVGHAQCSARENGWIITRGNKHYCTAECYKEGERTTEGGD